MQTDRAAGFDRIARGPGVLIAVLAAAFFVPFLVLIFQGDPLHLWLYDFDIFWRGGRSLLEGTSPYQVPGFYSPLPLAVLFAPLALLPLPVAYAIFVLASLWMLWKAAGWRGGWALVSFPVLFTFFVGQVDLILADRDFVKFLARGEGSQAELVHCPAYVLSWMRCEGCEGKERKPS